MTPRRPVLVFDGDCGFCRLWIARWRAATGDRVEYLEASNARSRFPSLKADDLDEAVHLVEPGGRVSRGAEAVFRSLAAAGGWRAAGLAAYERLPPVRTASEAAYGLVARNRPAFSRLTRLLWGPSPEPAPLERTRRLFLGGLGLVYLLAFWSFGVQVRGLIGANGLAPAADYLKAVAAQTGPSRWWWVPTVAWLGASDAALIGICAAGAAASLGLLLDLAAGPCALACWALYLSLVSIGGDFMGFQWDALLLETGLIACFVAPWALARSRRTETSRGAFLLVRLLLAKLMLESGAVKLLSGDASWRDLTALTWHYWTQPLPTPLAWYANLLPLGVQKASCAAMFAVELGAPLLLLGPRRVRAAGAAAIAALMVLIALTGNYGFFNLLTLVLCLSALDDSLLPSFRAETKASKPSSPWRARAVGLFAAVWLANSAALWSLRWKPTAPARLWQPVIAALEPLRSIDSYGLFAAMTKSRDELALEVSVDGRDWREWPFRDKPGDPRRAPPWVAPHMPRLDWQMWFASLGSTGPWLNNMIYRVLTGSPEVAGLLGPAPFGTERPRYARMWTWSTRFSTADERRAGGAWWVRERRGLAFPVVSLNASQNP